MVHATGWTVMHCHHLLLAMPGLLPGGAAVAQRGLPCPDFRPLLGSGPVRRGVPRRIQYREGPDATGGAAGALRTLAEQA
jgi:hypothetical protein